MPCGEKSHKKTLFLQKYSILSKPTCVLKIFTWGNGEKRFFDTPCTKVFEGRKNKIKWRSRKSKVSADTPHLEGAFRGGDGGFLSRSRVVFLVLLGSVCRAWAREEKNLGSRRRRGPGIRKFRLKTLEGFSSDFFHSPAAPSFFLFVLMR